MHGKAGYRFFFCRAYLLIAARARMGYMVCGTMESPSE